MPSALSPLPPAPAPAPELPVEQNLRFILGLKLNQLRKQQSLSLKELADRAGLAISYLSEIEKGKKYPKPGKILATPDQSLTGQTLLDEDFLRTRGWTDFRRYAHDPAFADQLFPDLFIDP